MNLVGNLIKRMPKTNGGLFPTFYCLNNTLICPNCQLDFMPNLIHRLDLTMKMKYFFIAVAGFVCVCNAHVSVRCVASKCNSGYYVSSSITDIYGETFYVACSRCPALTRADGTTQYGMTNTAALNDITDCVMPAGKYKDNTGVYEFTSSCKYVY